MTAVVGILNKQAVAIAADSAVTISGGNGRKIFNTANKIFTISKKHPVGVALYNSASFMSTPWETIIKMYREQLKDNCFPTVEEYQKDFIRFIREKNFFTTEKHQKKELTNQLVQLFSKVGQDAIKEQSTSIKGIDLTKITDLIQEKIEEFYTIINNHSSISICTEFEDYTLEDYLEYSKESFIDAYSHVYSNQGINLAENYIKMLKELSHKLICSTKFDQYTGLVFIGFGEDEIYPSLIPIKISNVIEDRLQLYVEEHNKVNISNDNSSCVIPFAQQDVIRTIISGVAPELDEIYVSQFRNFTQKYTEEIAERIKDINPEFANQLMNTNFQNIEDQYKREIKEVQETKYIHPLINAVAALSKEDLAEMAESLIYLTYLKRRITFAEESVGGPVDVALISKGDGFIWMKRKHYFDPKLNSTFFDNYSKTS